MLRVNVGCQRTRSGTLLLMRKKEVSIALAASSSKSKVGRHQFDHSFLQEISSSLFLL